MLFELCNYLHRGRETMGSISILLDLHGLNSIIILQLALNWMIIWCGDQSRDLRDLRVRRQVITNWVSEHTEYMKNHVVGWSPRPIYSEAWGKSHYCTTVDACSEAAVRKDPWEFLRILIHESLLKALRGEWEARLISGRGHKWLREP